MNSVLVLLSSYNGEKYIKEQIESVLHQKHVSVHLLIRDDGSTDSTVDIIKNRANDNKSIELIEGSNVGCAASFLALLHQAQSRIDMFDYFAFCDQDDYWMDEKMYRAIEKLSLISSPGPSTYFSNLYIVDENLDNKKLMYDNLQPYLNKPHLMVENFATGCTMVFNKLALNCFLAHPINNLRVHDIRLFHMCLFLGNIVYDENAYILYRQHQDNVIGANFYKVQRLKSKLRSLRCFWKQHVREDEAKEVLFSYGKEMVEEDRRLVNIIAEYRNSIKYRMILLFALGRYQFRLRRRVDTFWFKIRVLLGAV